MKLLLDTHVLLWWLDDSGELSEAARDAITHGKNPVFVSAVVIWEIRIKQALGKLDVPHDFRSVLDNEPFENLEITSDHAHAVIDLPMHHRDPFDRMLVAQATLEGLTVATRNSRLKQYDIPIIDA